MLFHETMVLVIQIYLHACRCQSNSLAIYKYSLHQRTPLHIAAKENYERTAECIIDQGADTNIKDNDGVRECTVRTTGGRLQNCYILEIHFVNEACCYPLSQAFCQKCFFLGCNLQKQEEESLVHFIM